MTLTNKAEKLINVGLVPDAIAVTPNGKTACVANQDAGTVTPITTTTNRAGKPIKVGKGPYSIVITTAKSPRRG